MAVYRNRGRWDTGNVRFADGLVQLYRKARAGTPAGDMDWIDYGITALRSRLVEERVSPEGPHDLADLYRCLSVEGLLAGLEAHVRFYEVGSPAGLRDFEGWAAEHLAHP
jgi:hypothetical protein